MLSKEILGTPTAYRKAVKGVLVPITDLTGKIIPHVNGASHKQLVRKTESQILTELRAIKKQRFEKELKKATGRV